MITVHHLSNSRSQRILWMLEELGFDYEIERYKRRLDMTAPRELKAIHTLGKSPVLEDEFDGRQLILVETGAICEYLVDKAHGRLGPPQGTDGILRYRQFLHYAEGSVMPVLFATLVASKVPLLGALAARRLRPMLDIRLDYVESVLSSRPWFAGDTLSAADIMMSFPLEAAQAQAAFGGLRPNTRSWLERIHSRPAYERALEKGGKYAFSQ